MTQFGFVHAALLCVTLILALMLVVDWIAEWRPPGLLRVLAVAVSAYATMFMIGIY